MFRNVAELVELAEKNQVKIAEIMIRQEIEVSGRSREEIIARWKIICRSWNVL